MSRRNILSRILLFVVAGALATLMLVGFKFFPIEMGTYTSLVHNMSLCFLDGQIPCRYSSSTTLFGSAIFNYLAPLPYCVGVLLYAVVGNLSLSVKFLFILPVVLGMCSVYFLLKSVWGRSKAMLLALSVSAVASFIVIWVLHLQLGLVWTIGFLPLATVAFLRFRQIPTLANSLILTLALALFLLMYRENLLIELLALLVVAVWFLKTKVSLGVGLFAFLSIGLSLGMTAYFWAPSFVEQSMVRFDTGGLSVLPASAQGRPRVSVRPDWEVLTGQVRVGNFEKGSNWFRFNIEVDGHSIIRLPIHYFPNWIVRSGGVELINYYNNNDLELITLILGEGNFLIEGRLQDTPIRVLSQIVSGISLGVFVVLLVVEFGGIKKALKYYFKSIGR